MDVEQHDPQRLASSRAGGKAPSARAPSTAAAGARSAEPTPHPIALLAEAGIAVAADGTNLLADGFAFRRVVDRASRRPGAKDELLEQLAAAWANPAAFRAMLQPTHAASSAAAGGGGALGDGVKDSVIRLLLQCGSVQTELAQALLESLADHQDELEGHAPPHAGMPLAKQVLSQFRWLEHIEDGSALLGTLGQMIQVAEPALRREHAQRLRVAHDASDGA